MFAAGCGRLFEGSPEQMWASLMRINALPRETKVFCGHEYTLSNLAFARSLEPANELLLARLEECKLKRENGQPTVPFTLGDDAPTNPFLRCDQEDFLEAVGVPKAGAEAFADLRQRKDNF